jgi:hypothetical protein
MMLICHTANFLYPKNKNSNSFSNLALSIPKNSVPVEYNKIYFYNNDKTEESECKLKKEAEIPCEIVSKCENTDTSASNTPASIPVTTKFELSDSEMAVIYRDAYVQAGRQVLLRTINGIQQQRY